MSSRTIHPWYVRKTIPRKLRKLSTLNLGYIVYIYIDILGDSAGFQTSIPHAVTLQRPDIRPSCSGQSLEGCSQRPARELGHHPHSNCGARGGGIPGLVLGMWYITKKYNVKST
jgi:hypothetical protein